jgi:Fe-S oxidoreductase
MDLGIDDDELATCVSCGLCLPHCPTYRVTGEEALSPRGRVAAMRQVQWDGATPDGSFVRSIETCVQCRGCETACPSDVPFGRLIEPTRAALAAGIAPSPSGPRTVRARPPVALRLGLRALRHHRLVLAGSTLAAVAQRLRLLPTRLSARAGLPARLPLRRPRLRPSGTDVWLFTGCVMDAWMRDVHADVQRVVEATGAGVALPGRGAGCCGALALHAGLSSQARDLAERTMAAFPGDAPVLVDAAGCGAITTPRFASPTNCILKNGPSGSSWNSNTRTMLACIILLLTLHSWRRIFFAAGSAALSPVRSFNATFPSLRKSFASQTSAMPPTPSRRTSKYLSARRAPSCRTRIASFC